MSAAISRRLAIASGGVAAKVAYSGSSILRSAIRLPRESAFIFWPRFVWDTLSKHAVIIATTPRLLLLKFVITRDAPARMYKDTGLTPVSDDEETTLDLLTNATGAHAAAMHFKKIARLTGVAQVV